MRNILSTRGGGIRGIIPCCCLIALEKPLRGLTRDHVDMCAGTLLTAVAAGIPTTDLLKVYPDRSDEIFTPTGGVARDVQLGLNECLINDQLCGYGRDLAGTPLLNLLPHWLEVSLHPVDTDRQAIFEREVLRVLCQHRGVIPAERKVLADEHTNTDPATQAERLVMTVAQSDGKAASFEAGFEIECPEHPRAVFGYSVFLRDHTDMAEAHALDEGFHHTMVCNRLVGRAAWIQQSNPLRRRQSPARRNLRPRSPAFVGTGPKLMQRRNPQLPTNIDEADLSAIPTLVELGQQLAATLDWKQMLSPGAQTNAAGQSIFRRAASGGCRG